MSQSTRLPIQGMTCSGCERHIEEALAGTGAQNVRADWRLGEARLQLPDGIDPERLREAVAEAGYQAGEPVVIPSAASARSGQALWDLLIIGSGSAAFAAAIEAREMGARVAMVEQATVGGTCVNIGCVPSKALLRAAEVQNLAGNAPFAGLNTSASRVEMGALMREKQELVDNLRRQKYEDLLPMYGVELLRGEAAFIDPERIRVGAQVLAAGRYLIATGATPAVPDIPGLAEVPFLTSTTALDLTRVPAHLMVIGAGFIALEMGQMFRRFGARVTLIQRQPRLLPTYEPEIAAAVAEMLERDGIEVLTGATYDRVEQIGDEILVHLRVEGAEGVVRGDTLLVATGRTPATAALQLEQAGVAVNRRGAVEVNDFLRTTNPLVYAAGDVTMGPQFVYVAAYEGALAARNALGGAPRPRDLSAVPAVTFTQPAIATVGLTAEAAQAVGHPVRTSVLPLGAVARALVNRDTLGVFKMVADADTGRVLGVHVVADQAGEAIYAATLAVRMGLTVSQLQETLAPYLTMAEGLRLSALTFDRDVSKLSCCAG